MKDFNQHVVDRFRIAELLAKEVTGSLAQQEEEELNTWKKEPDNIDLYRDFISRNEIEKRKKFLSKIDVDVEWYRFIDSVENEQMDNLRRKQTRLLTMIASSAAAIVLAVLLFTGKYSLNKPVSISIAEAPAIAPGTQNAQLILSNGDIIELDNYKQEIIKDHEVDINNVDGELEYKKISQQAQKEVKNTLRIPRGGEYKLKLSDGTTVWLNSESKLIYPIYFIGDKRIVELSGEAYFNVTSNPDKPFIVISGNQSVKVIGTCFNIKAYPEENITQTTLVEGKVEVKIKINDKEEIQNLMPDDQSINNYSDSTIEVRKVKTYDYTSWKDGRMVFNNETLESLMVRLSRWYDIPVDFQATDSKKRRFTGDFERYSDLNDILRILQAETSVNIELSKDNTLIIRN